MATAAEYPGALWIPSPHFWASRNGQRASWIIVHGTAGGATAQEVAGWFQTPQHGSPTSVHYIVGRDGTVVQCVKENNSAWGNGVLTRGHASFWNANINPNLQTISIEHVKPDVNNASAITAAQQAASFKLIAYLCAKHQIPHHTADRTGGITGHFSIDPVFRSHCPGSYPWAALFKYLGSPSAAIKAPSTAAQQHAAENNGVTPGSVASTGSGTGDGTGSGGTGSGGTGSGGTGSDTGSLSTLGATVGGVQDALMSNVGGVARAPAGRGLLGMVEQIDLWEQYPDFSGVDWIDPSSVVPFAFNALETTIARGLVVMIGLMIVLICVFNTAKTLVEQEAQVVAPVIGAATGGQL